MPPVPPTVTVSEFEKSPGSTLRRVRRSHQGVSITSRGKTVALLIPAAGAASIRAQIANSTKPVITQAALDAYDLPPEDADLMAETIRELRKR